MRHRDTPETLEWEVVAPPRLFEDVQQYSVLSSSSLALSFWTNHNPRRITRIISFDSFDSIANRDKVASDTLSVFPI